METLIVMRERLRRLRERAAGRGLLVALVLGGGGTIALALIAGRWGHQGDSNWDWGLTATVGTAGGTTLLAIATFMVAYGTRRPKLSLDAGQAFQTHSRVESDARPHLRLVVRNLRGSRSAKGTRVLVEGYRRAGQTDLLTLGSPSLGWPSAPEATDASVVVFGGAGRPVGLGELWRVRLTSDGQLETGPMDVGDGRVVMLPVHRADDPEGRWHLKLSLSHGLFIGDHREFLAPGHWIICLMVGADEADGRLYEVVISWNGDATTAQAALDSVELDVPPA